MKQEISKVKVTDNVTGPSTATLLLTSNNPAAPSFTPPSLNLAVSACSTVPANKTTTPPALARSSAIAPAPSSPQSASDHFLKLKINSLKEKQRANSFFNSLPPEQAGQLMIWIDSIDSLVDVRTRVTKPAPEGLGLNVSIQTLRRLRDAWSAEDFVTMATSSLDVVLDLEEQTGLNHAARFQTAMNEVLSERTFNLMRSNPRSELLPEMLANIKKLTELELKRQKLQLEREKLLVKHTARPPAATTAEQPSVQHHRVDLNIVPQNGLPPRETVVIESEPQSPSQPLLPRPSEGRG